MFDVCVLAGFGLVGFSSVQLWPLNFMLCFHYVDSLHKVSPFNFSLSLIVRMEALSFQLHPTQITCRLLDWCINLLLAILCLEQIFLEEHAI
jgi:hypothetical protein